jgi:diguanylate cyclase (GGDEF)-like protein
MHKGRAVLSAIKDYLFPKLDEKVERIVDIDSIKNIYHLSLVIGLFEFLTIPVFLYITPELGHDAHVSLNRVAICVGLCVCGRFFSGLILKSEQVPHNTVIFFKVMYCLALSAWAVWVSNLHYIRGDQLFTFFAVELLIVCFISLRPWVSIVLTLAVYTDLYVILFVIDGADRVNILNYIVLVFSSIMGMIMRYRSQARLAQMTVSQEQHSDLLEHANRHDGLTGLRNRKALEEDVVKILDRPVTAYMLDINYFKEINDTYGHIAGDEVLRETAVQIKKLFPESRCYRYGGDEFLVLRTEGEVYAHEFYSFHVPAVPREKIVLSIGHADGVPEDHDMLFRLIGQADESLYEAKRKTHSPEFGGHDRRNRKR